MSRSTTLNFDAAGQSLKSVNAVQQGIPFLCNVGWETPYNVANFYVQYQAVYRTLGPGNCPRISGVVARVIKSDNEFKIIILVGASTAFYDETTMQKSLVAEFIWAESDGVELDNKYLEFTFDNEDGEDWKNYTCEFSGSDYNPPSDTRLLLINIGFGRGDTGIENNEYLMQYYLNLQ